MLKKGVLNYTGVNMDWLKRMGKICILIFLALVLILLALKVYSYFSSRNGSQANKIGMATLNLEVTDENGQALAPLDIKDVYPGWDYEMRGLIRNTGSVDLIFRTQVLNGNDDFGLISGTVFYDLVILNQAGVEVYSRNGYLAVLNQDNQFMNILINPEEVFDYRFCLKIPEDMDDFLTPENEDDNQYQGKSLEFDLGIQSTQADNTSWQGSLGGASLW